MIENRQQFDSTVSDVTGFNERLEGKISTLKDQQFGETEIRNVCDPEIAFYEQYVAELGQFASSQSDDSLSEKIPQSPQTILDSAFRES
ncbi:MAG: hypothetical protein KDD42_10250 [Bdellovibrionales bacterium]|nr:hypothetical protein [Bdellovibrionales bacterium]